MGKEFKPSRFGVHDRTPQVARHAERVGNDRAFWDAHDATFGRGPLAGRTGNRFKDDPFFNPWAEGGTFNPSRRGGSVSHEGYIPPVLPHTLDKKKLDCGPYSFLEYAKSVKAPEFTLERREGEGPRGRDLWGVYDSKGKFVSETDLRLINARIKGENLNPVSASAALADATSGSPGFAAKAIALIDDARAESRLKIFEQNSFAMPRRALGLGEGE